MSKPNWDEIRKEWETTKKTYKELEEQFDVKSSTIRSRKNREKWERNATDKKRNTVATKKKSVATQRKIKEPVVQSDNLTEKQRLFCIYYIKYFNATKAYRKAYECDYATAMASGSRLLRNVKISAEIDHMKEEQTNELKLSVRDVLQKYIDIAFADITDYVTFGIREDIERDSYTGDPLVDENGEVIKVPVSYVDLVDHEMVDGSILTEVKQGRDGVTVKLADKMKALDMLSKYFDLLSDEDKEQLERERIKTDIAKAKAETERITKDNTTDAPPEIVIVDEWTDADG